MAKPESEQIVNLVEALNSRPDILKAALTELDDGSQALNADNVGGLTVAGLFRIGQSTGGQPHVRFNPAKNPYTPVADRGRESAARELFMDTVIDGSSLIGIEHFRAIARMSKGRVKEQSVGRAYRMLTPTNRRTVNPVIDWLEPDQFRENTEVPEKYMVYPVRDDSPVKWGQQFGADALVSHINGVFEEIDPQTNKTTQALHFVAGSLEFFLAWRTQTDEGV